MLYDRNGEAVRNEPQRRVGILSEEERDAIQEEMRKALLAYRNRHGDEPFAVFHIFGGVNTDWPRENLAVAALTRAYEAKYPGESSRARRAAGMAVGRIFKWVLWNDETTTYQIDGVRPFRGNSRRTFYRVIG